MIEALFTHPFLLMALFAGLAASITSGIMGSFVVVKRIVFISGSISHSVLGGMGLFLWLKRTFDIEWLMPMQGAIVAAILSALLIGWIHLKYREREDTVIAALWSTGMSVGVIFIALTPGYNVELMHYLFGNILWVTKNDLWMLLILDVVVIGIVALFRTQFIAICFDEQQARLQKVRVKFFYLLLLCLIALSVVLLIQVVGAILVIAMLAIPAAIATTLTHRFGKLLLFSVLIGGVVCFFGIGASYKLNWPPGATIALVGSALYLANFVLRKKSF
ncbi:MAG: Manganese transport system membrane protein MntB [Chlamydiae bacterium]|nr:Manganese transport system membrane protein MntB [Chlamydiota bacterium]